MLLELHAFIQAHRGPLLAGYLALLALTIVAFVVLVIRWSRFRQGLPGPGADITHRQGLPPGLAFVSGMLFLLLFVPFVVDNLARLDQVLFRNPGLWILGIFPLVGLALVGYAVATLWRSVRHPERLVLSSADPAPNGLVSGEFVIRSICPSTEPARVHLVLQEVHVFHWRSGQQNLLEHALWSASQEVTPRRRGESCHIPFQFRLPARLPPESPWQRREWVLVFELPGGRRSVRVVHAETRRQGSRERSRRQSLGALWQQRAPSLMPDGTAPYRVTAADVAGRHPVAELAASLFVAVFPWLFWFAMDSREEPWSHLADSLPPLLLKGAIALCLFGTALFGVLRWALEDVEKKDLPELGHRWLRLARAGWPVVLTGDALIAGFLVWQFHNYGTAWIDADHLIDNIMRGFIGMFVWLGTAALILTVVGLVRRRSRRY